MIYLLYGNQRNQIKEEINKLLKNVDAINISKYDLTEDLISNVIDDCQTMSLFEEKKVVIAENANMFTGTLSEGSEKIEEYINNYNPNTILILTVNKEKLDSRKKITKLINKVGKVISFNNEINYFILVKKLLQNYEISDNNINLIIERISKDEGQIKQEINKLKIYKNNNKKITQEDIENVISENIDVDIFNLIDNILKNEIESALKSYNEMIKRNEEPIKIIIILANQIRIMYQSKQLSKKGYSEKDIVDILEIHPYRVKLALKNSRTYSSNRLLSYLKDLAQIDENIKNSKTDKSFAFELFLLKKDI